MKSRVAAFFVSAVVGGGFVLVSTSVQAGLSPCGGCGSNAATVGDGIVFDELNLVPRPATERGVPTLTDVQLELQSQRGTAKPRRSASIDVKDGRLNIVPIGPAMDPHERLVLTVAMLDGRAYELRLERALGPDEYPIHVDNKVYFWAEPPPRPPTPSVATSYVFRVRKIRDSNRSWSPESRGFDNNLCNNAAKQPLPIGALADTAYSAFVFADDHYPKAYEPDSVVTSGGGFFNLACFGTAAAKMHLLRHTEAASPKGKTTTLDQRTAMLRAIRADYCGDGKAWTGDGTPLYWTDQGQWFPLGIQVAASDPTLAWPQTSEWFRQHIEAAWGQKGELLCLNEPRRKPRDQIAFVGDKGGKAGLELAAGKPPLPMTEGMIKAKAECTKPSVTREEVVRRCPLKNVPRCDDFNWGNPSAPAWAPPRYTKVQATNAQRVNPSDFTLVDKPKKPLLSPNGPKEVRELGTPYVITVNRDGDHNYCGTAEWP